jgi:hypothetical protein
MKFANTLTSQDTKESVEHKVLALTAPTSPGHPRAKENTSETFYMIDTNDYLH